MSGQPQTLTEGARRRPTAALILAALVTTVGLAVGGLVAADRGDGDTGRSAAVAQGPGDCRDSESTRVPQPTPAQLKAAGLDKLPLAPERDRVDLVAPPFSKSTNVTNSLFPISKLHSAILNGEVDGKPFRVETTLLPETRIFEWIDGQCVETLVSQYVAYSGGRIHEVALDHYAQDDNGNAWYLGEDVFNYADGIIAELAGTWLAGREGPAAMIMPGDPQVGNAYRPENIAGLVFEEVTVKETGKIVDGPRGKVPGAIVVQELHQDGTFEEKIFAPGYGEFFTGVGKDVEALAVAAPIDALPGPLPAELRTLSTGADEIFDAARSRSWKKASTLAQEMSDAWRSYEQSAPPRLQGPTTRALEGLVKAVGARERAKTLQASVDVAIASTDLELQFRKVDAVDLARFDAWLRQVIADAHAHRLLEVTGDLATLEWIRDRFVDSIGKVDVTRIDTHLGELRTNVEDEDFEAAVKTAWALRAVVDEVG